MSGVGLRGQLHGGELSLDDYSTCFGNSCLQSFYYSYQKFWISVHYFTMPGKLVVGVVGDLCREGKLSENCETRQKHGLHANALRGDHILNPSRRSEGASSRNLGPTVSLGDVKLCVVFHRVLYVCTLLFFYLNSQMKECTSVKFAPFLASIKRRSKLFVGSV